MSCTEAPPPRATAGSGPRGARPDRLPREPVTTARPAASRTPRRAEDPAGALRGARGGA